MAGIGEVASIIGVLQFGFSLAKTLTEYIGEFKAAATNITALANNIEVTFRQADELQDLLKTNQNASGFSESARINAVACCLKTEQLGEELWQMLGKSNVSRPAGRDVERQDIDLSLFDQALWPRFKPRVEEAERKFLLLKLDITISIVSYHGQNTLSGDSRPSDTLENLKKSRKLAVRELRAARKRRKGVRSHHVHFPSTEASPPVRQRSGDTYEYTRGPMDYVSYNEGSRRGYDADAASITSSLYNDIEESVLKFQRQDEANRTAADQKKAHNERLAREQFEKDLAKKIDDSQIHVGKLRERLSELFDVPPNAPAIDAYVKEYQAQQLAEDDMTKSVIAKLGRLHLPDGTGAVPTKDTRIVKASRRERVSSLFGISTKSQAATSTASRSDGLPMFQPHDFSGRLSFIGLLLSNDGNGCSAYQIGLSRAWLNHALALEADEVLKKGGPTRTVRTYATIPAQDTYVLTRTLTEHGYAGSGTHLVYARELTEKPSRTRRLVQAVAFAGDTRKLHKHCLLLVYFARGEQSRPPRPGDAGPRPASASSQHSRSRSPPITRRREILTGEEPNQLSPAEQVREQRRVRKSEYDDFPRYGKPADLVDPYSTPAGYPIPPVYVYPSTRSERERSRPIKRGSYDRRQSFDDLAELSSDGDDDRLTSVSRPLPTPLRAFAPYSSSAPHRHDNQIQDQSSRGDLHRDRGYFRGRSTGTPMINIYNDQTEELDVRRPSSRFAGLPYSQVPPPPAYPLLPGYPPIQYQQPAPLPSMQQHIPQMMPMSVPYPSAEYRGRSPVSRSTHRARGASTYKRWQKEDKGRKFDGGSLQVIERASQSDGAGSRKGAPMPSTSRLDPTVEDYESSSEESGTGSSEPDLSDSIMNLSTEKSWRKLKMEAAEMEALQLAKSSRNDFARTEKKAASSSRPQSMSSRALTESPTSYSDAEKEEGSGVAKRGDREITPEQSDRKEQDTDNKETVLEEVP